MFKKNVLPTWKSAINESNFKFIFTLLFDLFGLDYVVEPCDVDRSLNINQRGLFIYIFIYINLYIYI